MAEVEVFIGDLEDPAFQYEGGDWNHNYPKRISPFLPDGSDLFYKILDGIYKKELVGRQTDWGSHTCLLYPYEMIQVLSGHYAHSRKGEDVERLFRMILDLDPGIQYGLVACEMG